MALNDERGDMPNLAGPDNSPTGRSVMHAQIDPARLAEFDALTLKRGSHREFAAGACAMEAAAYIANEPHSDQPQCVCPVLTSFMVGWNDGLPSDEDRDRLLKPLIPRLIGTRGDGHANARSWLAVDWLIRVYTPAWLAAVPALAEHADRLRALPPVLAMENVTRAMEVITRAREDAAAARAAAGAAARAAAWDAAGAAAWDAAGAAARAAAWDAAGDAAWAAAWAAAGAAAGDALAPTVTALQESASELAEAMIVLGEADRLAASA